MKNIFIGILVIFGIIFIIISIIKIIYFFKYKEAFYYSFVNNIQCDKNACIPETSFEESTVNFNKEYDKTMAKYCINLIQILYNNNYSVPPKGLSEEITLKYNIKSKVFGTLWYAKDKNTLFIIFRGTTDIQDIIKDLNFQQNVYNTNTKNTQVSLRNIITKSKNTQNYLRNIESSAKIHNGFFTIYLNIKTELIDTLTKLNPTNIVITGHSLGAAVATICAADLYLLGYSNIVSYIFASPRIGNQSFANIVKNISLYSIINNLDIVPTFPYAVSPNFNNKNEPNMFIDSGQILRFSANWSSVSNNHYLGVYNDFLPDK